MEYNSAPIKRLKKELSYSVRRFFVDQFYFNKINNFPDNGKIIDLGGIRFSSRSAFQISEYKLNVKIANLDPEATPDYLCDISNIPEEDSYFDGAILSEVLEHIYMPETIIKEAHRLIKPQSTLLITVPFSFYIHPCPEDYARYTPQYLKRVLEETGFENIEIQKQGGFFLVITEMLKSSLYQFSKVASKKHKITLFFMTRFVFLFQTLSFFLEKRFNLKGNISYHGYTTGFGIICKKK